MSKGDKDEYYLEVKKTFCGCISVRAGTLILSFVNLVTAAVCTILSVQQLFVMSGQSGTMWIAIILRIFLWAFVGIVCFYGFIGAWSRKRVWVQWYLELLWWHLWALAIVGLIFLIILATSSQKLWAVAACRASGMTGEETCSAIYKYMLLILDFTWALSVLIQIWLLLIVAHFVDELYDEEMLAKGIDIEGPPPFKLRGSQGKGVVGLGNGKRYKDGF
ncbi:hypothetical protein MNV49_007915 [Pseudohyphozyma bogoriensis]|nr:hypothetical protein MNV49_007915 [Pseudohyphozyma bogoriensis]